MLVLSIGREQGDRGLRDVQAEAAAIRPTEHSEKGKGGKEERSILEYFGP
jgi:hypothetical protein